MLFPILEFQPMFAMVLTYYKWASVWQWTITIGLLLSMTTRVGFCCISFKKVYMLLAYYNWPVLLQEE